jgi:hypothetical protein
VLILGDELLLLALDAKQDLQWISQRMRVGLNVAGLAELTASGWLLLRQPDGRPGLTLTEGGDPEVLRHRALAMMLRQIRELRPAERHPEIYLKNWAVLSLHTFLKALRDSGSISWDKPTYRAAEYGRFHILDPEAAKAARARIERVATGTAPSERDLDLAGIVHGLGLDKALYRGLRKRAKREALATALAKQRFALLTARAMPKPAAASLPSGSSGTDTNIAFYSDM